MPGHDHEELEIGDGASGTVWLKPCRKIVVKYPLKPNEKTKELFKRECDVLKKLNHPNIITFLGIQVNDAKGNEKFGILMEYCQRGDLAELIFAPKWSYTRKWAMTAAKGLFEALDYLWQQKLTHRDIKPTNIFVKETFLLKLGDFGAVREIEETVSATFGGRTLRYLSPPQFENDHENPETDQRMDSHKNDVYSLGLTIWEMIERRRAFEEYIQRSENGEKGFNREKFTTDIQQKRLTHLERLAYGFESIVNLVESCTQFNRKLRPNARQVLEMFWKSHLPNRDTWKIWDDPDYLPFESNEPKKLRPDIFLPDIFPPEDSNPNELTKDEPIIPDAFPPRNFPEMFLFRQFYRHLSATDQEVFHAKFPQIISEVAEEIFYFDERDERGFLVDRLQLEDDLFARAKDKLRAIHRSHLGKIADLINESNYCTPGFIPWHNITQIKKMIKTLQELQAKMIFYKRKVEEFLLFDDDPSSPKILKSDFTQRPRIGQWVPGSEKKICLLGDDEFHLSETRRTIDMAKILTLLEEIKNGIERQTKQQMRKFISLEESENRSRQIADHITDSPTGDIAFQLRNPPRHHCICTSPRDLGIFANEWERLFDQISLNISPFSTVSFHSNHCLPPTRSTPCECQLWDTKSMQWADICLYLQHLYEGTGLPEFSKRSLPDHLVLLQVVSERDERGAHYLTLLDHPLNYENYEKIWCMSESFSFEKIHVSKIRQCIQETRTEERRFLWFEYGDCRDNLIQTLDHQGNVLPSRHDQLGDCVNCFLSLFSLFSSTSISSTSSSPISPTSPNSPNSPSFITLLNEIYADI